MTAEERNEGDVGINVLWSQMNCPIQDILHVHAYTFPSSKVDHLRDVAYKPRSEARVRPFPRMVDFTVEARPLRAVRSSHLAKEFQTLGCLG